MSNWLAAPNILLWPENITHVWFANLDISEEQRMLLAKSLSSVEMRRAENIRLSLDQARWIAAHGFLRIILGRYLQIPPGEVSISPNLLEVENQNDFPQLVFSLSHSQRYAVYAVTAGRRVGIDIEAMADFPEMELIVKKHFSSSEAAWLASKPDSERLLWFYKIWTGKESVLKATRDGITKPLNEVSIGFDANDDPELVEIFNEKKPWHLSILSPNADMVGTLAVEGTTGSVCYWKID